MVRVALPLVARDPDTLVLADAPGSVMDPDQAVPDVGEQFGAGKPVAWAVWGFHARYHTVTLLNVVAPTGGRCVCTWSQVWAAVCVPPYHRIRRLALAYIAYLNDIDPSYVMDPEGDPNE